MPGGATIDGPQNGYTVNQLVEPDLTVIKIRARFEENGVIPPALIVNDSTAVAYGILNEKLPLSQTNSTFQVVFQISTATGISIFKNRQLLLNADGYGRLGEGKIEKWPLSLNGHEATYLELADWKTAQQWLAPEIKGLKHHQLAEIEHPDVETMLQANAQYVKTVIEYCKNDCQLLMSGGGSLAFKKKMQPLLADYVKEIIWTDNAEQPGLEGLRFLTFSQQ